MLTWVRLEQGPEVRAAGREDDFVGREGAAVAGQRDVDEVLLIAEVPKGGEDARVVIVPAQ